MMLELKHLMTIAAIDATGSVTDAAARLHLTQSALSHQLKALETVLGQPVLVRTGRPLRLTPAGRCLLTLAQRVLPEVQRAEAELRHLRDGLRGRLYIVVECHSCYDWLLPAMDEYRRDWPDVELDLVSGKSFSALPALAGAEVDLVITSDPVETADLAFVPLFRFEILLALAPGHPLAAKPWLQPLDLQPEVLICYPVERARLDIFRGFLEPAGITPAGQRTAELSVMILQLVKNGRGVAALPSWVLATAAAAGQIAVARLGETGLWATLYAAVRASDLARPFLNAFVAEARQTARRLLTGIEPVADDVARTAGKPRLKGP